MNDFADLGRFVALPRLTALALSPAGDRLVVVRQQLDAKGAKYVPALWQLDPDGGREPIRLTRSEKGESRPAFRPDGALLFVSARPDPDGEADEAALWQLPPVGEPTVVARIPGGVSAPVVAAESGTVLVAGSRLAGSSDAATDRQARKDRAERKLNHILHEGYPIRYWDRELDAWPRLFALDAEGPEEPRDLTGDTRLELLNAEPSISADGRIAVTGWRIPKRGGQVRYALAVLDVAGGGARVLTPDDGYLYFSPSLSPDGRWVAAVRQTFGDFDTPTTYGLVILAVASGTTEAELALGDVYPRELVWSGDGGTLVVTGDLNGRGAVNVIDAADWTLRRLVDDAVYASVCVDHTGTRIYALRTSIDRPAHPVRLGTDGAVTELAAPDPAPELPGRLTEVTATAPDGETVRAWLCLPAGATAADPVPVQLWIHGGPFGSWNAWSWRWCPWVAVARGYAVLLPDPALSTGYGAGWFARSWPHRADGVWRDVAAVLDATLERPELDAGRTSCHGGSFGGFMASWIAGHTDRFRAIVTHAGLWALEQHHTTTDVANWRGGLIGTPADQPAWFAENSPDRFVDAITTPMLVIHGNRDYRVPISEALRLWWELVSRFDGEPDQLPHRFLQFTDENHWIMSPANARVWYETVLDFVDRHVAGVRP